MYESMRESEKELMRMESVSWLANPDGFQKEPFEARVNIQAQLDVPFFDGFNIANVG